jgi:hypothetical protein
MRVPKIVFFAMAAAFIVGCTKDYNNPPPNPPAPIVVDSVVSSSLQIQNATNTFVIGRIDVGNLPLTDGWDSTLSLAYPLLGNQSIAMSVHSSMPEFLYVYYAAFAPHTITIAHAAGSSVFNVQPGQSAIYAPSIVFARNVPVVLKVN